MYELILGDSFKELDKMETNSVDSVVTDPPYELVSIKERFGKKDSAPAQEGTDGRFSRLSKGFLGQEWDGTGIQRNPEFWAKVLRVLKPGGFCLAFGGTRTYHRMVSAMEDSGFEIRDMIGWVYGQGFPKSLDLSKEMDKRSGIKRKIIAEFDHHVNVYKHSGSGTPQDINRWNMKITEPESDLAKKWEGWGTSLKPAIEPIVLAKKPIEEKTIVDNVLKYNTGALNLDACRIPIVGEEVPINKLEKWSGFGQEQQPDYEQFMNTKGRWPANLILEDEFLGDKSRFFYCPKPSPSEKKGNSHPTKKPLTLLEYLVKLITVENGICLDPFMGSGTTGVACLKNNFNFIGIEMIEEYYNISKQRMENAERELNCT